MSALDCHGRLHPQAEEGLVLFSQGRYWQAHEALEQAWLGESGPVRHLYRGILQAAVVYHHILRANYAGAVKVYARSRKWLDPWPETCRGVRVGQLRLDLAAAVGALQALGPQRARAFDRSLLKPVAWEQTPAHDR
jgi:uncharacterized protein